MTSIQGSPRKVAAYIPEPVGQSASLAQIVGLVCLCGFVVDMLILALPFNFGNIEWRISMFQQMGDRSIVLLLGAALLLFANQANRQIRKPLAWISLAVGVFFLLSSLVAIRDGSSFNKQASAAITSQASAVQEQLEKAKVDSSLAPNVTPEQMQQAEQELQRRADAMQKQAKLGTLKKSSSSVGNLLLTGFGLIALGRIGGRSQRRAA